MSVQEQNKSFYMSLDLTRALKSCGPGQSNLINEEEKQELRLCVLESLVGRS